MAHTVIHQSGVSFVDTSFQRRSSRLGQTCGYVSSATIILNTKDFERSIGSRNEILVSIRLWFYQYRLGAANQLENQKLGTNHQRVMEIYSRNYGREPTFHILYSSRFFFFFF